MAEESRCRERRRTDRIFDATHCHLVQCLHQRYIYHSVSLIYVNTLCLQVPLGFVDLLQLPRISLVGAE